MEENTTQTKQTHKTIPVKGMYEDWFLDYASYVILERAVPHLNDGLKPVQRRILHSMKELDDGRYNKVANIVGNTMKYHPHGDASIGDALVGLGQKELLIDCQGNWGNILTGDSAAASRYIEARLSKFALDVVFNPQTTKWRASYDGRNKEPETLPIKFPLLLAQGVEGIAVGLACKILPHNFIELIESSIKILKNEPFEIFPDFLTGGSIDVSKYNQGLRGGKIRVRAKISVQDKKTLVISEIPFGTTTGKLIDSIIKANEKGKIKIKKIDDNTAQNVEIIIQLPNDTSIDQTIDALYAFTDCEVSISPNSCVIEKDKPHFLSVNEMLERSTQNTIDLLQLELEIELDELKERWQWISLEKIFIENEIYERIKPCTTDQEIDDTIIEGLKPFIANLLREPNIEDIHKLRKIPIDRISKFNSDKANDILLAIEDDIKQVNYDLEHIIDYSIAYFERILKKYGQGKERKTEIRSFDTIEAQAVAVANEKLYCNYKDGFAGYRMKNDEYVCECSDIDDIIAFRSDGTVVVKKVQEKDFFGTDIIYINVFKRNDERTIYNLVYQDGAFGKAYVKRFSITNVIRDKEYVLTKGVKGSKIIYFSANPNGEAEVINVSLKPKSGLRKLNFDYDFSELAIKGRNAQGNILSRYLVRKIIKKMEGISTLSARKIWFDESVKRLNADERGRLLGEFSGDDKIIAIYKTGYYRLTNFDLQTHFADDLLIVEKFNSQKPVSIIFRDKDNNQVFLKRFLIEEIMDKMIYFIEENANLQILHITNDWLPMIELVFEDDKKGKKIDNEVVNISEFMELLKYKAKGKRLSRHNVKKLIVLDSLPFVEEIEDEEAPNEVIETTEDDLIFDNNKDNNDNNDDDFIQGSLF
ncbi:MAG: DNA gyrase/topoisomerase IV subunit A [Bacteroidales bacterium]|jgi:topoisomerase-4 subunit A|nr:DNA gyrase/topoisomerase IV subunit A [Bacteroidales bacterium]MDD4703826.1 DNA gyrase/topoisomerase IV subunit A [Bacteroidales bacterium]